MNQDTSLAKKSSNLIFIMFATGICHKSLMKPNLLLNP